jgi:hypothetical protein
MVGHEIINGVKSPWYFSFLFCKLGTYNSESVQYMYDWMPQTSWLYSGVVFQARQDQYLRLSRIATYTEISRVISQHINIYIGKIFLLMSEEIQNHK